MTTSTKTVSEFIFETIKDAKSNIIVDNRMMDFDYVDNCQNISELKEILRKLLSGREGRYPELEAAVEKKILSLMPEKERKKILAVCSQASHSDVTRSTSLLHDWIESIETHNVAGPLITERSINSLLPPVRTANGTQSIKHQSLVETTKKVESPKKNVERISKEQLSNRDYFRQWDKFDVDKAVKDVECDGDPIALTEATRIEDKWKTKIESQNLISTEQIEQLRRKLNVDSLSKIERTFMASREKDKGNECFRNRECELAIAFYSKSIALNDGDAVVFANRAMACIRVSNLCQAIADCNQSLAIDPTYTKALARRGTVHHKCGRYLEARTDFAGCVQAEPENKEYKQLWDTSNDKYVETGAEEKHDKSKKKILIVEDDESSSDEEDSEDEIIDIYTPGALNCRD